MNDSITMTMAFPWVISAFGFMVVTFVGMLLKGQSKMQDTLIIQSETLASMQKTLESVMIDRLPKIEAKIDRHDERLDVLDIRVNVIETRFGK